LRASKDAIFISLKGLYFWSRRGLGYGVSQQDMWRLLSGCASDLSTLHLLPLHGEREGLQVLDALSVVLVARVVRLAQDENHKLIAVNLREA
jgi:hypothetical protein